ncbi:PP2C family protein-serine/threonine phosphatase [Streptomyces sp. NPDC002577]
MEDSERQPDLGRVDLSEGFRERLLEVLLDRSRDLPAHLIGNLVADEVRKIGGRDVSIFLQDYDQLFLMPLTGRGLTPGEPQLIADSDVGLAFQLRTPAEVPQPDGIRIYLPMPDDSDDVGVLALTLDTISDDDRRLLRSLAGLVAGILATKRHATDLFFQTRRRQPMTLAAEIQWSLLPPLTMAVPQVEVAGILEPAYAIAGDSFDYCLNEDILHVAVIDAMGHGLDAATMATVAIGAYRHARRAYIGLSEIYTFMDEAIAEQFGPDHFVTAQMMLLNIATGRLQWVNAGHPVPLLICGHRVIQRLNSPTTLPVGFGGHEPEVSEQELQRGDRILCFTDGLVEERNAGGEEFGEEQLIDSVNRHQPAAGGARAAVRSLSHALRKARGRTTDDATLVLIEWRGGTADHLSNGADGPSRP